MLTSEKAGSLRANGAKLCGEISGVTRTAVHLGPTCPPNHATRSRWLTALAETRLGLTACGHCDPDPDHGRFAHPYSCDDRHRTETFLGYMLTRTRRPKSFRTRAS